MRPPRPRHWPLRAPPSVAQDRLRARMAVGHDPSDATPDIYDAMAAGLRPWPAAERIDTGRASEDTLVAALGVLDRHRATATAHR